MIIASCTINLAVTHDLPMCYNLYWYKLLKFLPAYYASIMLDAVVCLLCRYNRYLAGNKLLVLLHTLSMHFMCLSWNTVWHENF